MPPPPTPGSALAAPELPTAGADPELDRFVESQEFVRGVMAGFLHGVPDVDVVIDDALRRLGEHLGVDRTYVFVVDPPVMDNTHEWCASGIAPEIDHLQRVPLSIFEPWLGHLDAGEPIEVPDVGALPPARSAEREHFAAQGIQSLLVVPMVSLGELVGLVGFDSVRRRRSFSPSEVELLRALADVMTSVFVRQRSEHKAAYAEQRLAALTRYSTDFIMIVGDDHLIRFASRSWDTLGLGAEEIVGTDWRTYVHGDDVRELERLTRPIADQQVAERVIRLPDFRLRAPGLGPRRVDAPVVDAPAADALDDGTDGWRWFAGAISDVRHDGVVDGLVVNLHEVTERRRVQDQLARDVRRDPLTGLANRTLLTERLRELGSAGDRVRQRSIALVFLDLDRFKLVNDGHGHAVGDEVLVEVARRLSRVVRGSDIVARFGGDEFVVLLETVDTPDDVDRLVARLEEALEPPVVVRGQQYRVSASMGVVFGGGEEFDPLALMRDADTAMYRAKENGRGRVVVFDDPLRTRVLRRLTLLQHVSGAIADGGVGAEYQPVVELSTGRIVGAEALARWTDSSLGVVSPNELVALAEEIGEADRLTGVLLDLAIGQATTWPDDVHVAVNLSFAQLIHPELTRMVVTTLERHAVGADRLSIEVTESSLMEDQTNAVWALGLLRELGVRTALDDFGTGYSSLSVLRELPVDVLKVDRTFVRGVHHDDRDLRLVRAVIDLARDFRMETMAEGVETPQQEAALIAAGCSFAQGHLYGRAMSGVEFRDAVTVNRQAPRGATFVQATERGP